MTNPLFRGFQTNSWKSRKLFALAKEKWKAKTKLKLQRKREKKKKRKAANKRDPRRLGVKGMNKQKFDTPEERIKHKIENAKDKEAMRIERLKRYEVSKVQGPEVQPHFLTVTCKPCKPGQIQEYGDEIARLSGGIPIQIVANDTIVFSRGREYVQPEIMYPIDTLSKKRALEKSKYEQSLESLRRFIAIAEKELELYYRHVAVYDDPNNRIAYSILDDSRSTSEKQNGKIGEENYSSSESIASDLELSQIDDGCVVRRKLKKSRELEFDYNTKETRVGIEEGISLEVKFYAMRVLIKGGV
ncbi:putative fructokinase [Capsicum annuum]|nr:putative fructokinase [Capsicum annuum]